MTQRLRIATTAVAIVVVALWVALSVVVELDGRAMEETLNEGTNGRALVLFHPSLDARFADDLSLAVAEGFQSAGFTVRRATLTSQVADRPQGLAIVAVVSNTYYWTPDLPTLRYLRRAHLDATEVIGLIGGAGSTGRSERVLNEALRRAGGQHVETRSFWLARPNDETRPDVSNREVALDRARQFALARARSVAVNLSTTP